MTTEIHVHLTEQPPQDGNSQADVLLLQELSPLMSAAGEESNGMVDMELDLECTDDGTYILPETDASKLLGCTSIVGENIQFQITFSDASQEEMPVKKEKIRYKCFKCNQQFTMELKYTRHMLAEHDIKAALKCPLCCYRASTKKLILRHAKRRHKESPEFTDISSLCITEEPPVTECYTSKQRRRHVVQHKNLFSHTCTECNKGFVSKQALKRHAISHLTDRNFVCAFEDCGKSFKHLGALTDHKKQVHSVYKNYKSRCKPHVNEVDGENNISQSGQSGLSVVETENVPKGLTRSVPVYPCSWESCGKEFKTKHNLKCHYATHTGQKDRLCPHCEYTCIQLRSLNFHIKKHHS